MAKYVYPAVFKEEADGRYSIHFPDVDGCYTCGENLKDGIQNAEDALALMMYEIESTNGEIPTATNINAIKCEKGEFASYIVTDTLEYQKKFNNRAVKKTLTIPEWLNEAASKADINFSQLLQEAIKNKLGLYKSE